MISFLCNLGKGWLAAGVVVVTVLLVASVTDDMDARTAPVDFRLVSAIALGVLYFESFLFVVVVRTLDPPRHHGPLINRRLTLAALRTGGFLTLVLVQTYVCLWIGFLENEAYAVRLGVRGEVEADGLWLGLLLLALVLHVDALLLSWWQGALERMSWLWASVVLLPAYVLQLGIWGLLVMNNSVRILSARGLPVPPGPHSIDYPPSPFMPLEPAIMALAGTALLTLLVAAARGRGSARATRQPVADLKG